MGQAKYQDVGKFTKICRTVLGFFSFLFTAFIFHSNTDGVIFGLLFLENIVSLLSGIYP